MASDTSVWLNTRSGTVSCSGNRWYGATREGLFIPFSKVGELVPGSKSKVSKVSKRGGCRGLV
jgi:hypothetical protein